MGTEANNAPAADAAEPPHFSHSPVMAAVRRALGRTPGSPVEEPPAPPVIEEPITRLVHTETGLAELFCAKARENKMSVVRSDPESLGRRVTVFLQTHKCGRIAMVESSLVKRLGVAADLRAAGLEVNGWDELTLDALYDMDAGLTPVDLAVAETGSLVIRSTAEHGKAVSLVPRVHVAIVEPANLVPDLVDLFERLGAEGCGSNTVIITGPSKTADIEMQLVTGVHGPGVVGVFLVE